MSPLCCYVVSSSLVLPRCCHPSSLSNTGLRIVHLDWATMLMRRGLYPDMMQFARDYTYGFISTPSTLYRPDTYMRFGTDMHERSVSDLGNFHYPHKCPRGPFCAHSGLSPDNVDDQLQPKLLQSIAIISPTSGGLMFRASLRGSVTAGSSLLS